MSESIKRILLRLDIPSLTQNLCVLFCILMILCGFYFIFDAFNYFSLAKGSTIVLFSMMIITHILE